MKITRQNYEAYFIDYLEGNLDEQLVDVFIDFLQQNPDLKEELELFSAVTAVPESLTFNKKKTLYHEKYDLESAFNQAAVARLEGDLSAQEMHDFEAYILSHPEKQEDIDQFDKTRLKADESIRFEKKNKLYKRAAGKTLLLWSTRVAAILIVGLVVFSLVTRNRKTNVPTNQLAQVEESKEPQPSAQPEVVFIQEHVAEKQNLADVPEKPVQKKAIPKKSVNTPKIIQKNAQPEPVIVRARIEMPQEIKTLTASLDVPHPNESLGTMYITVPETSHSNIEEKLLAEVVLEKTGLNDLSMSKIKKAGLKLVSGFTKENLTYKTDAEGEITEINYDSRLLAFTIPTNTREKADGQ
ncbi:hypothetical protein INQ51_07010 [Maribellus sp. CM-23]|uniref:cytochrome c-type biogenesis protein CcmH n=1 Tax=Maribellus sp. CM-23 TaxID=2781026 RepID=UPI001F269C3D|nr:cytochrome c-type biogenesis protein CcmH [Maribellus sp. CM-23]MCE4564056.1 hypothetical protein [Maribellus sp. CM-23]